MIDIHCHILPGVDDGSPDMQTSMLMAAMAADDGVTDIIATPHFDSGVEDAAERRRELSAAYSVLRRAIAEAGLPLNLYLGAEVLCTPRTIELLDAGLFPTMNGTSCCLVEFYFDEREAAMCEYLAQIAAHGLTPIVAHPERYDAMQHSKSLAAQFCDKGLLLQINTGSLSGLFGRKAQKTAKRLLDGDLVSFAATDAHDTGMRSTLLKDAKNALVRSCGAERTKKLLLINPRKILNLKLSLP